jgi:phosphoglycerol transferase MdoB-like AlkP superfamily enzyme
MQQLLSLFKQLVFWLIFFAVQRAIFLFYYSYLIRSENIEFGEVLKTFYYALKLDISMASYILIFPMLLLIFQTIIHGKWADYINKIYVAVILLIYMLVSAAEIGIYSEWQTKMSYKGLLYLRHPDEILNSSSTSVFIFLVFIVVAQFLIFIFIYNKYIFKAINYQKDRNVTSKFAFFILSPAFIFLGIRGGFQAIPISSSQSYFSKHNLLNLAAVNSGYNLAFSSIDNFKFSENNVFNTMTDEEALLIVEKLHAIEKDTTVKILTVEKPNVVVILLESWSGDLIESLGGDPGITPKFRQLEKEGILFTKFYATGNRSQQAMASFYAGFPAIPIVTLTDHPEKYKKVPSLVKEMKKEGYFTSFYFGGQLIYGNIKSFLVSNEFDKMIEGEDFDEEIPRGKLGVHDEYLFNRFLKDVNQMPRPFFATAFTLSSHSPYDQPGERPIEWIKLENQFVNSAHYADSCLGDFMKKAKTQSWYANTLFVIMADHSHASYKGFPLASFDYHHVPLLLTGGALKEEYRGVQSEFLTSNVDVTTTLLKQLGIAADDFFWSKNIFNPNTQQFAFFELNEGLGWKRPYGEQIINLRADLPAYSTAPEDKKEELDKEGRAYMQVMLNQFLSF